jgi:hypothetical protein
VSLTTTEKLQAISSPWENYITHLEKTHVTINGSLIDLIDIDNTCGHAFHNTGLLIYCCVGLPTAPRIPSAAKLKKWLMVPDERPSAMFKEAMAATLDHLWELTHGEELDAPFHRFKAKVAPIEFVYIGALHPLASHPMLPDSYPPSPHRAVPHHVLPSYKLDNSYMPATLSIHAGTSLGDLQEVHAVMLDHPDGWITFDVSAEPTDNGKGM